MPLKRVEQWVLVISNSLGTLYITDKMLRWNVPFTELEVSSTCYYYLHPEKIVPLLIKKNLNLPSFILNIIEEIREFTVSNYSYLRIGQSFWDGGSTKLLRKFVILNNISLHRVAGFVETYFNYGSDRSLKVLFQAEKEKQSLKKRIPGVEKSTRLTQIKSG